MPACQTAPKAADRGFDPFDHFAHEDDYPDLDVAGACARLAAALACRTVFEGEATRWEEFDRLQDHLRVSFPAVMAAGSFELVGHSVLITVTGEKPELPGVLLLAHQDVVPVVPGTEGQWAHGAFSGHTDDEWVWGRGALDIKDMLMAELEALEWLLAHRGRPARTVWLAFGEDEEVASHGATAVAAELERRGCRAAFSLDEGVTTFYDGADWGAPGTVLADICISQKGFANVTLTARGAGGHSSNPFGGTSLERLCRAVARLAETRPAPELIPIVADTFRTLAPHITQEPFAGLVADVDANAAELALAASRVRGLYPFVSNTMAANCLNGASTAANVMPGDVSATVNFRLLPGTSVESVMDWARAAAEPFGVEAELAHHTPAGRIDSQDGYGYAELKGVMERYHPGCVFVPSIVCGGTDSVRYEGVADTLLRVCPFRPAPEEEARGVHGVNERISRRVYAQGIRVLIALLEKTML